MLAAVYLNKIYIVLTIFNILLFLINNPDNNYFNLAID